MRVHTFSVENVRSVREKVDVTDLAGWEVFHGENNVGKTNLLLGLRAGLTLVALMAREPAELEPEEGEPVRGELRIGVQELPARLAPHRERLNDPIHIALVLSGTAPDEPPQLRVEFTLRGKPLVWEVSARWCTEPGAWETGRLPVRPLSVRSVDAGRTPPPDHPTWDEWILSKLDADETGVWRHAYSRLEQALATLVPGFDGGRLERRRVEISPGARRRASEPDQELVWITSDLRQERFENQGSGVRAMKDLLIGATAGDGLCIIEEPEVHLSEALQFQLLRAIEVLVAGVPAGGLQIFLTSHTGVFDHQRARRVTLCAGATCVDRPASRTTSSPAGESAAARWAAEGQHNEGYASAGGVVLLPSTVRHALTLPCLLHFDALGDGFLMTTHVALDEGA